MKNLIFASLLISLLSACGKIEFSANTDPSPNLDVAVVASAFDYYAEAGQAFSDEVAGDVSLTNVVMHGQAVWPGASSVQLELRLSLTGTTDVGSVSLRTSKPTGWDTAFPVATLTISANSTNAPITSTNLKDTVRPILERGRFWVLARIRYSGLDLGNTLSLRGLYVHADGEKSLENFSPLINLGF